MTLTKINQHVFSFKTQNYVVVKQHIINYFEMKISWKFITNSRISTLRSGHYMQVIKSLGHQASGRWLRCTGGHSLTVSSICHRSVLVYFLVLFCCYIAPLLFTCSTIPWYFDCSANIQLYVPPVFWCSASVPVFCVP